MLKKMLVIIPTIVERINVSKNGYEKINVVLNFVKYILIDLKLSAFMYEYE